MQRNQFFAKENTNINQLNDAQKETLHQAAHKWSNDVYELKIRHKELVKEKAIHFPPYSFPEIDWTAEEINKKEGLQNELHRMIRGETIHIYNQNALLRCDDIANCHDIIKNYKNVITSFKASPSASD